LERGGGWIVRYHSTSLPQPMAAMDATTAAHAVQPAAVGTRGGGVGERLGALDAVRLAHRVGRSATGTNDFSGNLAAVQVGLDLAGGKIASIDVLSQIGLDKLEEPTLLGWQRAVRIGQLCLDRAGRVHAFGELAGGELVERTGQGEQVAARFGLADDLFGRGVTLSVHARLGSQTALAGAPHVARSAEVDHLDTPAVFQEHQVV